MVDLRDVLLQTYQGWKEDATGEGLTRVWTGIMGYSRDELPFIGPVPDQQGLWAAVAFHGHGGSSFLQPFTKRGELLLLPNRTDSRL